MKRKLATRIPGTNKEANHAHFSTAACRVSCSWRFIVSSLAKSCETGLMMDAKQPVVFQPYLFKPARVHAASPSIFRGISLLYYAYHGERHVLLTTSIYSMRSRN